MENLADNKTIGMWLVSGLFFSLSSISIPFIIGIITSLKIISGKKVVAFSVPCDLLSSVKILSQSTNKIYSSRFLKKLGEKIKQKEKIFPGLISYEGYEKIKHFVDFDNRYTAPLHGFTDAYDFYKQASVKPFLPDIKVPSLIVQAKNDTFLSSECFVFEEAEQNKNLFMQVTKYGGHCGFMLPGSEFSWAELRALEFAKAVGALEATWTLCTK